MANIPVTLVEQERFPAQIIGRYAVEFDTADKTLRLCWSGSQTFLNHEEAVALFEFLVDVLPNFRLHTPERPFCSDATCGCHTDEVLIAEDLSRIEVVAKSALKSL